MSKSTATSTTTTTSTTNTKAGTVIKSSLTEQKPNQVQKAKKVFYEIKSLGWKAYETGLKNGSIVLVFDKASKNSKGGGFVNYQHRFTDEPVSSDGKEKLWRVQWIGPDGVSSFGLSGKENEQSGLMEYSIAQEINPVSKNAAEMMEYRDFLKFRQGLLKEACIEHLTEWYDQMGLELEEGTDIKGVVNFGWKSCIIPGKKKDAGEKWPDSVRYKCRQFKSTKGENIGETTWFPLFKDEQAKEIQVSTSDPQSAFGRYCKIRPKVEAGTLWFQQKAITDPISLIAVRRLPSDDSGFSSEWNNNKRSEGLGEDNLLVKRKRDNEEDEDEEEPENDSPPPAPKEAKIQ